MTRINKITKIFPQGSTTLSEEDIQDHFDEQNNDGWYLIGIDNLVGWYRFFWAKDIE